MSSEPNINPEWRSRTFVLVGMMGAGKSTVGRRLAQTMGLPFFDADAEIETAAGFPIADIFDRYGEPAFRDGERRVIARLLEGPPHILATGGGAFIEQETRELIRAQGISIWLDADLDVLVDRVGRRDDRPLLRNGNPKTVMAELKAKRDPIYAEADIAVKTGPNPHNRSVQDILKAIRRYFETEPRDSAPLNG